MSLPTCYLAGPMVFYPNPGEVFARMKAICARHGMEGVAPLDNQLHLHGIEPGKALISRIVEADIELMNRLDSGVFCLDGFRRGPEMDPGTAFEVGWMAALGKPLAGWTDNPRCYPERVARFFREHWNQELQTTGAGLQGATSGILRDPDGMLVHSEGCVQNGMVQIGIERDGGKVFASFDWRLAFSAAVENLARRLGVRQPG